MPHVRFLISGVTTIESDTSYFRKRASEERTAALHARTAAGRQMHQEKAEHFESRVRAIAQQNEQLKAQPVV